MIQKYGLRESDYRGREFISHPMSLAGCNDILNLTSPKKIYDIHLSYLENGSDIITTNTFNANSISLKDYGMDKIEGLIRRINREGALLARKAVEDFEKQHPDSHHYVAGSIGPTNRSASMSPDISHPGKRNVTFDELFNAYSEQIKGLIEGGVDILLFETFYDGLNLKSALDASNQILKKEEKRIPLMVSVTSSDKQGHLLTGQSLEALVNSILDYENIISIGLNCSFGPEEMGYLVEKISGCSPFYISCYPNAGLPDENGCYSYSPERFREGVEDILKTGKVNFIGGCCGTTPEHISGLKELVEAYKPYKPKVLTPCLRLSGNEPFEKNKDKFLIIGERCNVAGSKKFLRLIKEGSLEEATEIALMQVRNGAKVLDINMDDPLLDGKEEIVKFIRYLLAEPEVAKVPFMIDSSDQEIIESALKNMPGKGAVNSLSLKEGEEIFERKARRVKELGSSLVVMSFDEKGPGDTFERKIEICRRAYNILTEKCGFKPWDIIFDVGVMAIATGMPEHSRYALDFIKAVEWIKKNLPYALTSGGISNLSFSFRGKNKIRETLHTIFLHHAIKAGLDMAIANPSTSLDYDSIDEDIRTLMEDVILSRNPESEEKLLQIALTSDEPAKKVKIEEKQLAEATLTVEERLRRAMVSGELKNIDAYLNEALGKYENPLEIVEGPLMDGMKEVGDLFGAGKMFLPQVIKTARVMNHAVEFLKPHFKNQDTKGEKRGKILMATVKGDVHDIGKNIVGTVLACNNYEIIDMGVMVPSEDIVKKAKESNPDIICLSGLITPSLAEMKTVVEKLNQENILIPVMIGGAATSKVHTALKISPYYDGLVVYMSDASQNPIVASELLDKERRENYIGDIKREYEDIRNKSLNEDKDLIPFELLLKNLSHKQHTTNKPASALDEVEIIDLIPDQIVPLINWKMFFKAWNLTDSILKDFPFSDEEEISKKWYDSLPEGKKEKGEEILKLFKDAKEELNKMVGDSGFDGKGAIVYKRAWADERNIYTEGKVFPMLRQQRKDSIGLSCADFINRKDETEDYIGFFAVTAGRYWFEKARRYETEGDNYRALMLRLLADRFVEASSEWLDKGVIRPAWGYPMLPDQKMLLETADILPYDKLGIRLTENGAMSPPASISGLYILNDDAKYFMVGEIGEDQKKDYESRRRATNRDFC